MSAYPVDPIRATIEDLAWLPGRWTGSHGVDWIEERWSDPAGGAMLGAFRAVTGGHPRFYELLALDSEGNGLVFRFRHFDHDLVGWEERTEPLVWDLVALTATDAVFLRRGVRKWMTYRHDPPDHLAVFFEDEGESHDPSEEYRFDRS